MSRIFVRVGSCRYHWSMHRANRPQGLGVCQAPLAPSSSSPATGWRASLPGGRTATMSMLVLRVATLVLTRTANRTAGCLAKLVWQMACWWSPIWALAYCTAAATMWVIRINLTATSGVSLKDRLRAFVSQRPRHLVSNLRYVSVSDAVG